jgi:hypothetical protein
MTNSVPVPEPDPNLLDQGPGSRYKIFLHRSGSRSWHFITTEIIKSLKIIKQSIEVFKISPKIASMI